MQHVLGTTRDVASIITAQLTPLDKQYLAKTAGVLYDCIICNDEQITMYAVSAGIETCDLILNTHFILKPFTCIELLFNTACRLGKFKLYKHLETIYNKPQISDSTLCIKSASGGNLKLMLYLLRNIKDIKPRIKHLLSIAVENGHVEILDYIYNNHRDDIYVPEIEYSAICKNRVDVLEWIVQNNIPRCVSSIECTMSEISTDTLKWMLEHGWEYQRSIPYSALQHTRMYILKYLHSSGYTFDAEIYNLARGMGIGDLDEFIDNI